jgi:predicted Zn-dependent peptidase
MAEVRSTLFPKTTFAKRDPTLGGESSLSRITKQDVVDYWSRCYGAGNASFVSYGNISAELLGSYINDSNARFLKERDTKQGFFSYSDNPYKNQTEKGKVFILKAASLYGAMNKKGKESYNGYVSIPFEISNQTLKILLMMLKSISRRMIREQNSMSYSVNGTMILSPNYKLLSLRLPSLGKADIESVIIMIEALVAYLRDNTSLFKSKQDYWIRSYGLYNESVDTIMSKAIAEVNAYRRIITFEEDIKKFSEVTIEDINNCLPYFERKNMVHVFIQ